MLLASIPRVSASSSSCFVSSSVVSFRRSSLSIRLRNDGLRRQRHGQSYFSSSSSDEEKTEKRVINVSRLSTLQTLLTMRGAPGSIGCSMGNGDLLPVSHSSSTSSSEYHNLHPHLLPLAKSKSSGHVVCALRRWYADESETFDTPSLLSRPWPIVESAVGMPGMRLLSLNSEHLMRRIAADADVNNGGDDVVEIYNDGLGNGRLSEKSMDEPYVQGSVTKLGYGLDKYILLRVGPFPDLYETMSNIHLSKNDIKSSLIAAEASNGKFGGRFGSTFVFYAKLLASQQREEESRDAARMTLRMSLSTMGLTRKDYVDVARMTGYATADDDGDVALTKMLEMYEKIRNHENKDEKPDDKTLQQKAIEDVDYILDKACLMGQKYGEIRREVAAIYRDAVLEEDARFIEDRSM